MWCTLMKSAASGLRNVVHAPRCVSYSLHPVEASGGEASRSLIFQKGWQAVRESAAPGACQRSADEGKFTVAEKHIKIEKVKTHKRLKMSVNGRASIDTF